MSDRPHIKTKKTVFTCPWITIVESDVVFANRTEAYYAVQQSDYVAIIAQLSDGRIPLVRQYRPAVDTFTLELPAGTVDPGETAESAAKRELLEETGVRAIETLSLGAYFADSGRLCNKQHAFWIQGMEPSSTFVEEPGVEVVFKRKAEVEKAISTGEFNHQLHIGAFYLALKHLK